MDIEDDLLIAAARQGHPPAREALYLRYRGAIADLAFRYLGNRQDAEELLQDVFVKCFRSIHRYEPRPDARFFSWIYKIAVNSALNYRKKRSRDRTALASAFAGTTAPASPDSDPETRCWEEEFRAALDKGLAVLSPGQKMIFVLKHHQQMTTAEVAEHMGCSEGSVRRQLHRAVVKLRAEMAAYRGKEAS